MNDDVTINNTAVKYKNEVWTGTEYQVASHLIYEGFVKEGLAIVRGIHDRYDGLKRNPWNEIEAGEHYARAMASWGCLITISGFIYDGPAQKIGFVPRLNKENFNCFYSSAKSWGNLIQKIDESPKTQTNTISVKYGELPVKTLQFQNNSTDHSTVSSVRVDDREYNSSDNGGFGSYSINDGIITITLLESNTIIKVGESLKTVIYYN